ncbi:MAG: glycoside hydrolase family 2 TIM barrel-domain containing protein [Bacteroidota bacterium]
MRSRLPLVLVLPVALFAACGTPGLPAPNPLFEGPRVVEVVQTDGRYHLTVDGTPFFVNGAGLEFGDIDRLASHGANSFRTWRTDNGRDTAEEVLDRAFGAGLMVTMGLEIAREREGEGRGIFGFDYDDEAAVAEQLERIRGEVGRLKDHPALLMWGIGNELNLGATNPKVWDAVGGIAAMIEEVDPNHPTTTMLAGLSDDLATEIKTRAPALDILSVQFYGAIGELPRYIEESGWDGPLMVTEWGATGHWEVAKTPWNAPIENNSTVKADLYGERYRTAIATDTTQILGSYVFLWGQKQERTPTWYGMFMPSGEKTESVDVMQQIWTGAWPENRAPRLASFTLDGRTAGDGITMQLGQSYEAAVAVTDPDNDALRYEWQVLAESQATSEGGDDEDVPPAILDTIDGEGTSVTVTAPAEPGAYRLFVNIYDQQGSAAHANIPFLVEGT